MLGRSIGFGKYIELYNHHHYNQDIEKHNTSVGGWICDQPVRTSCCGINKQERVMVLTPCALCL